MGAQVKRKEDPRLITGASTYTGDIPCPASTTWPSCGARTPTRASAASTPRPRSDAPGRGRGRDRRRPHAPLRRPCPSTRRRPRAARARRRSGGKHYPLSIDRVRHVGEAVAAVIAATEAPPSTPPPTWSSTGSRCPRWAIRSRPRKPGAPQLHADAPGNVEHENRDHGRRPGRRLRQGASRSSRSAWSASASAACRSRGAPRWPRPTRPPAASPSGPRTQAPHAMRNGLATPARARQNQIRVIAPEVGGGFGVKFGVYPEDAVLAAMARSTALPAPVGRDARRAHDGDDPRPRPGRPTWRRRSSATAHHRAADARAGRHGRLPDLHLHPRPDALMGVGVYHIPNVDLTVDLRLHQHDARWPPTAAPAGPRPPTTSSA